jgi:hydrogenase expression/formation protein HypC
MCLAVPARVEKIDNDTALVDFGGVKKKVSLGILARVKPGDHVLVHAGFAIGKVSDDEAAATRRALDELDEALRSEGLQGEDRPALPPSGPAGCR